jgi:hypothetical protein
MDRAILVERLARTEKHIEEAKFQIARQRAVIRDMQRSGHDLSRAQEQLDSFEDMALSKMAERDRIQRELAWDPLIAVNTVPRLA